MDGRDVLEISSGYRHFPTVQVAGIIRKAEGFVIFSHFKGDIESAFGGARPRTSRWDLPPALRSNVCMRMPIHA